MSARLRWDVFCRVVDNFGDAGVCWRLARQLANEHPFDVRLRMDDLETLRRLQPAVRNVDRQRVDGVEIIAWRGELAVADAADIVIESFGCGLPESYVMAMAAAARKPIWIVLEYLSAESWVAGHHGLPSPHPRLDLERYFFFPGFTAGTGGLQRERDLIARRDAFDAAARDAFWNSIGHAPTPPGARVVSLFAYESAPLADLLEHWAGSNQPVVAAVSEGRLVAPLARWLGVPSVAPPEVHRRGALEVRVLPFVPQVRYDELLWTCDVNFVRGEDSFVRAQWAARPLVWQIYEQEELAHALKLDAFLDRYCAALPQEAAASVRALGRAWNRLDGVTITAGAAWEAFSAHLASLEPHAGAWAENLAGQGELAGNLASFCLAKLK